MTSAHGERSTELTVADIMTTHLLSCSPETSVGEAARLMEQAECASIVVREDNRIVGIWTERDSLHEQYLRSDGTARAIHETMHTPVQTLQPHVSLEEAASRFEQHDCRHLIVVDDAQQPKGILSHSDLLMSHGVEWFMQLQRLADSIEHPLRPIAGEQSVSEVIERMRDEAIDALVVDMDSGSWSILTERDVLYHIAKGGGDVACATLANRPVRTLSASDNLFAARNVMLSHGCRHIGVVDENGRPIGLIGFRELLHAIEQGYVEELEIALRERSAKLHASEERYRALVDASPDAIAVHADRRILFINPAGARLVGAEDVDAPIGRSFNDFLAEDSEHSDGDSFALFENDSSAHPTEVPLRRMDGTSIVIELQAMPIDFNGESAWQVIMRDITRRKETEHELRRLATTDQLTGVSNRSEFERHLDHEMRTTTRYGHPLSVIMFDLNRFKQINDEFGHSTGDEALQHIAATVSSHLRDTDVLARWGGDEFMILLPETGHDGAEQLCHKLCAGLQSLDSHRFAPVGAAFALAEFNPREARRDLLRRLDRAVYRAKDNNHDGRSGVARG